jgi:signal transduction histidine kinase
MASHDLRTGADAVLEIRDLGAGMEPVELRRAFEPFERGNAPRNVTGAGLGLFIAREIVAAHGGRLSVESRRGVGSTFRVELPIGSARAAQAPAARLASAVAFVMR